MVEGKPPFCSSFLSRKPGAENHVFQTFFLSNQAPQTFTKSPFFSTAALGRFRVRDMWAWRDMWDDVQITINYIYEPGSFSTPWSLGMGNLQHGYINPYYWVDDHPLLYGNIGSLDPSTCANYMFFSRELTWAYLGILKILDSTVFWERNVSSQEGTYKHISGQFIIIEGILGTLPLLFTTIWGDQPAGNGRYKLPRYDHVCDRCKNLS